MPKKSAIILLIVAGLSLLGCESPTVRSATRISGQKPSAVWVAAQDVLRVGVNQPVKIDGYFTSKNKLGQVEIFVNDQPLRTEQLSEPAGAFAAYLATVQVLVNGSPVLTNPVQSAYSNSTWAVSVVWTGKVPGTYNLSMQVTDNAQQAGNRITQRIEVQ